MEENMYDAHHLGDMNFNKKIKWRGEGKPCK